MAKLILQQSSPVLTSIARKVKQMVGPGGLLQREANTSPLQHMNHKALPLSCPAEFHTQTGLHFAIDISHCCQEHRAERCLKGHCCLLAVDPFEIKCELPSRTSTSPHGLQQQASEDEAAQLFYFNPAQSLLKKIPPKPQALNKRKPQQAKRREVKPVIRLLQAESNPSCRVRASGTKYKSKVLPSTAHSQPQYRNTPVQEHNHCTVQELQLLFQQAAFLKIAS